MTKYHLIRFVYVCLMLAIISSCAISRGTINSYTDPTYQTGSIKRLAVFSIRNASFAPSEARQINQKIIKALYKKNPGLIIISPSKALRAINKNKLADEWADYIEDYYTGGIPNQELLMMISKALNVDAVMQGQLINISQRDGSFGVKGMTRITITYSVVESRTAKPVWEVSSDGIKGTATANDIAPPLVEAVDLAINKIIDSLPIL